MARKKRVLDGNVGAKRKIALSARARGSWCDEKGKFRICACQMRGTGCICNLQEQALIGY